MRVAITDFPDLIASAINDLEEAEIEAVILADHLEGPDLGSAAAGFDAVLVLQKRLDAAVIARLERPRLLVKCGIGYDNIDVDAAALAGIAVANVPRLLRRGGRRPHNGPHAPRSPGHRPVPDPPRGRLVHRNRPPAPSSLRDDTRHRRHGADRASCRPSCSRVRDGRPHPRPGTFGTASGRSSRASGRALGPIVGDFAPLPTEHRDQAPHLRAAADALDRGTLAHLATDVLDGEPHPGTGHRLLGHPDVVVTSHVAWYSNAARRELGRRAAVTVLDFLAGNAPPNVVNDVPVQSG